MTKKIYGKLLSRAGRVNWAALECGIDFELIDVDHKGPVDQRPAELLAVNPAGTIPTYVDGGFSMTESFAIGLYLARRYKPVLMGGNHEEEGKVYQWTLFAATDFEKIIVEMLAYSGLDAAHPRNDEKFEAARKKYEKILAKLNHELEGRDYLVGCHFTLADLNVACVMTFANTAQVDRRAYGNVQRWLQSCRARPAFQKSIPPGWSAMYMA